MTRAHPEPRASGLLLKRHAAHEQQALGEALHPLCGGAALLCASFICRNGHNPRCLICAHPKAEWPVTSEPAEPSQTNREFAEEEQGRRRRRPKFGRIFRVALGKPAITGGGWYSSQSSRNFAPIFLQDQSIKVRFVAKQHSGGRRQKMFAGERSTAIGALERQGRQKNAIDWASRPYGQNSFSRKLSTVIGTSPGAIGTALAQQSLRSVLAFCNSPMMNSPEAYIQFKPGLVTDDGEVTNSATADFLRNFMTEFYSFITRVYPVLPRPA